MLDNQHKTSLTFLANSDDPITLCMLGCVLYDKMLDILPSYDTEGQELMRNQMIELETLATDMLSSCYSRSPVSFGWPSWPGWE